MIDFSGPPVPHVQEELGVLFAYEGAEGQCD